MKPLKRAKHIFNFIQCSQMLSWSPSCVHLFLYPPLGFFMSFSVTALLYFHWNRKAILNIPTLFLKHKPRWYVLYMKWGISQRNCLSYIYFQVNNTRLISKRKNCIPPRSIPQISQIQMGKTMRTEYKDRYKDRTKESKRNF